MSEIEIYHNPRCSKSRQTLALLEEQGFEPTVIEYLKNAPTAEQVKALITALDIPAHQLLRHKESEYAEHNLSPNSDEQSIINAIVSSPKLLERPIVVKGNKAKIGRPPETVLEIL